ncbi:Spherulation-specific family 4 [Rhizoctonia solani]|uniref:Spherulation-specific family 4 n=1 Tax=Rhizoctonia solani TaxID=456999 RepID=A0A8H7HBN3_9AGAM|nr:Spherulation-specific family 4 [Rhizoctonia solani]
MLFARAALASGIIFPLYIYPGTSCSGWTPLINAITTHPNLPFWVVVNPASGPGAVNSQPDANYQACIPQLRPAANPNVKVLGYVPTGFGSRAQSAVQADITTYSQWGASYKPNGIFFDEVAANSANQILYSGYSGFAKNKISGAVITLNPGVATPAEYYGFSDQIVTREDNYNNFSPSQYTIGSSTPASKQAVILHTTETTPPTCMLNAIVRVDKIGAVYFTSDVLPNPYDMFPPYWAGLVDAVQAAASA